MMGVRMGKRVVLVAAYAAGDRMIGAGGEIPWHLPVDFAHFKRVTTGHTLVMGRRTWESIGRPLPGRRTVVVTSDRAYDTGFAEVLIVHSLSEAFAKANDPALGLGGDIMVVGGGEVYAQALPWATHMVLTEVAVSAVGDVEGDAFFPVFDEGEWVVTGRDAEVDCVFTWWERNAPAVLDVGKVDVGSVDVAGGQVVGR